MEKITRFIKSNPISWLVLVLPLAIFAETQHWGSIWVFVLSAIGVIPMAAFIGKATEALTFYTGPKIGGLLNATLGNAAELIITLVAIREGYLELVKASITGSILGNILLVLGVAMVTGGLKNGIQKFDRRQASNNGILLVLAVLALVIPSLFSHYIGIEGSMKVEAFSLGVAAVMIVLYVFGIIYSLGLTRGPLTYEPSHGHEEPSMGRVGAIILLAIATVGVVLLSELLVGAVEVVVADVGLSEFFLGIILIPIVGNVAEHLVAVQVAYKNQMDLSVEIAISSSLQIALFVAPLLVFISLLMGNPLTLIFNQFELLALGSGAIITALVSIDGESNWLEGMALISIYLILGLAFFLLPAV